MFGKAKKEALHIQIENLTGQLERASYEVHLSKYNIEQISCQNQWLNHIAQELTAKYKIQVEQLTKQAQTVNKQVQALTCTNQELSQQVKSNEEVNHQLQRITNQLLAEQMVTDLPTELTLNKGKKITLVKILIAQVQRHQNKLVSEQNEKEALLDQVKMLASILTHVHSENQILWEQVYYLNYESQRHKQLAQEQCQLLHKEIARRHEEETKRSELCRKLKKKEQQLAEEKQKWHMVYLLLNEKDRNIQLLEKERERLIKDLNDIRPPAFRQNELRQNRCMCLHMCLHPSNSWK